jgi:transposase
MFHWWHRVWVRTLTHASFRTYMQPVRREVERLLEVGQSCGVPKTEGTCREIFKRRQALWTFVRHEGVEPTNNAAERAIRPGVLTTTCQAALGGKPAPSLLPTPADIQQLMRSAA